MSEILYIFVYFSQRIVSSEMTVFKVSCCESRVHGVFVSVVLTKVGMEDCSRTLASWRIARNLTTCGRSRVDGRQSRRKKLRQKANHKQLFKKNYFNI